MGFFDSFAANSAARKGYATHVMGNRLSDQGKAEEARKKHEEAIEMYEKAFSLGFDKPGHYMAYGVLLLRFRRFEEAKEIFLKTERNKAITKDERAQLRINYAVCQWKLGELDSAIENLKISLETAKTGTIYGSLGYMMIEKAIKTGDFTEALAFNEQALDYDDEDPVILDNMGQLYLAMGEKDKAKEYFEKAHERKPSQVDTLYFLASLAIEQGEKDKAKEYLTRAVEGNYSALCTTSREQAQSLLDSIR